MNKTITKTIHNPKNETLVSVAQIIELGKATALTLGGGSGGAETRNRPFGGNCRTTPVVELGKATKLTLGARQVGWETSRPRD
jgi:hypothetical protein